ncbi:MAG: hydroxyacylglutathione hydrolase family protein [Steroidobacteraceae bacterium]
MIVERIWAANDYRNFHYLIACGETGEALAVDPLDWQKCLAAAKARGWTITQILNTHEHRDSHRRQRGPARRDPAPVLAHAGAAARIGGVDRGLARGDVIRIGRSAELECLDTPGHTLAHVCLFAHAAEPALFCGDTLFNAGAGNCHNGGAPELLYDTFVNQISRLPDATRIYPGHDYLVRNLEFTLDREPDNREAADRVAGARAQRRRCARDDAGRGEAHQHLPAPAQPRRDRAAARRVPGPAGRSGSEDRVPQAARAAQQVVNRCTPNRRD